MPRPGKSCQRCALPLPSGRHASKLCGSCLSKPPPFHFACSAFIYAEPVKALLTAFKHQAKLAHGRELCHELSLTLTDFYHARPWPRLLLPVPLHPRRLRQRGFNQALELARQLSRQLHIPLADRLCRRQLATASQQGLNARQRRSNLRGAFRLEQKQQACSQAESIAIIDDVMTTMSTMREISSLLRGAGFHEIHVWTLARALKSQA